MVLSIRRKKYIGGLHFGLKKSRYRKHAKLINKCVCNA